MYLRNSIVIRGITMVTAYKPRALTEHLRFRKCVLTTRRGRIFRSPCLYPVLQQFRACRTWHQKPSLFHHRSHCQFLLIRSVTKILVKIYRNLISQFIRQFKSFNTYPAVICLPKKLRKSLEEKNVV